jgi:hypothetical protein
MSRKSLAGRSNDLKLHKLAANSVPSDTDLDTKNWLKMNRTGVYPNPQDFSRLPPVELGSRIKNNNEAEEIRQYMDYKHPDRSKRFSDEKILADLETFHDRQAKKRELLNSPEAVSQFVQYKNARKGKPSPEQLSTLSNSTTPNRVGILRKSDVHELLNKPR